VRVEEFYSSSTTPLLPFILFGLDDAKIPARYHRLTADQANDFDIHKTDSTDNVHVYHDMLNIIGKRMREHPNAKITLTGCTSNDPQELADNELAIHRADAVGVYLERVWNIDPKRIRLEARGLPEKPSSLTQEEGREENRRVEITSNDPALMNVITLGDTDLSTNPPMMQFVPTVHAQAGVKFWDLYVTQAVQILHHEFGKGTQPKGWNWDLHGSAAYIPRTEDTIEYGLRLVDSAGQTVTTTGTIPVRQVTISKKRQERTVDKVIERYTLVLFDFGSSKIDPQNQRAIEYIKQQITPGTQVEITGYADRLGDDAYDQKLTEDRANAVAKMIGAPNMTAKGVGKSVLLYDNNIPEGRFYSRTVNIVLYKPVNQ
jgi:outer membrane protein OmpA-like peptidoglycan-associated protein